MMISPRQAKLHLGTIFAYATTQTCQTWLLRKDLWNQIDVCITAQSEARHFWGFRVSPAIPISSWGFVSDQNSSKTTKEYVQTMWQRFRVSWGGLFSLRFRIETIIQPRQAESPDASSLDVARVALGEQCGLEVSDYLWQKEAVFCFAISVIR